MTTTSALRPLVVQRFALPAITRAGVMATAAKAPAQRSLTTTMILSVGAALIGLGVGLLVGADLGLPPYDVLVSALRDRLGLTLGQAGWVFAAVLLALSFALGRRPSLSSYSFIVILGISVDQAVALIDPPDTLWTRWAMVAAGIGLVAAGVSLVVHRGAGCGAFELVMLAVADRGHDLGRTRAFMEVTVLGSGIALGGDFGPATVIFATSFGPLLRQGSILLTDHRRGRSIRLDGVDDEGRPVRLERVDAELAGSSSHS